MYENYKKASELFSANKIVAATALFEQVLVDDPQHDEARFKLGVCRFRQKEYMRAENIFRLLNSANHQNHEAWYYLGLSLERQGRSEEAIAAYKIALTVKPNFEPAKNKIGTIKQDEKLEEGHSHAIGGQPGAPETEIKQVPDRRPQGENINTSGDDTGDPGELIYSSRRRLRSFERHIIGFVLFPPLMFVFFEYPWRFFFAKRHLFGLDHLSGSDVDTVATVILVVVLLIISLDAILRSRTTRYRLYERRLDIHKGILNRSIRSIWLFKMSDLTMKRSPISILTKNASIDIEAETGNFRVTGLVPPKDESADTFTHSVFDQIRTAVRGQRGKIKKMWA